MLKTILFILLAPCALTEELSQRIIGGQPGAAGRYPFAAGIHVTTNNGRFFCGGTLLNNLWIVTAGQCVDGATLFTIRLGSTSLSGDDPESLTVATSTYVLHPDFNPETLEHDIGLIELRLAIELTTYIQPIYTLPVNDLIPDIPVSVIGWGQTSDDDSELSEHLNYVTVTTLTNEECKLTYGNQITENMLCVVGNLNEGACIGDTGSALIDPTRTGNGCLAGISSFLSGNGCESTDPSGYTRVYPYVEWIQEVTGRNRTYP